MFEGLCGGESLGGVEREGGVEEIVAVGGEEGDNLLEGRGVRETRGVFTDLWGERERGVTIFPELGKNSLVLI